MTDWDVDLNDLWDAYDQGYDDPFMVTADPGSDLYNDLVSDD